jgi:G3E family GTPase
VDGALPAQADPFEAEDPTAAPRRVFAAAPVHGHGEGISTFSLCRDAPVAGAALALFLETLVEHLGADLLRLKGVVRLQESPARPAVVQVAQHVLHPLQLMQRWPQGPGPQTRMVFIVRGDGRDWVERLFDAAAWEAAEVAARLCPRAPGSSMQEDTACSISS